MTSAYHLRKAAEVMARGVRPHYVYFIVAMPRDDRNEALVKIGTATDVDRRLSEIRRGGSRTPGWLADLSSARSIDLAGWVVADAETERHLHKAFAQHALGGEWFALAPIRSTVNELLHLHCACRGCEIEGKSRAHI